MVIVDDENKNILLQYQFTTGCRRTCYQIAGATILRHIILLNRDCDLAKRLVIAVSP